MLTQIRDYVFARPEVLAALSYVVTSLLAAIFHARSSDEYESRPPRVAAMFKLFASVGCDAQKVWLGIVDVVNADSPATRAKALARIVAGFTIDPPKLLEALYQLITGTRREDDDGGAPPLGPIVAVFGLALMVGCSPSPEVARDQARATVLTIARGVHDADMLCAELAYAKKDGKLARTCADAYDVARDALLGAESAVDAWDDAHRGDVACAAAKGVASLTSMVSAIQGAGGKVPAVVTDALTLAPALVGVCRG